MASTEEFKNAGTEGGIQIWRMEKSKMVLLPKESHGSFYAGDAYILLQTNFFPPSNFTYSMHTWIGSECSMDEKGAAAIYAMQLEKHLNLRAAGGSEEDYRDLVRFARNTETNETPEFLGFFKTGIIYKQGGISSGFNKVTDETDKPRLFHVRGRRNIKAIEKEFSWGSFNQGDCFIIDLGNEVFNWKGSKCNAFESNMASRLAISMCNNEKSGRARFEVVEEGSEPQAIINALGEKPENLHEPIVSDESVDKSGRNKASLYLISDAAGAMKTTLVGENPFKQSTLSSSDCYILDNSAGKRIFIWKGKDANKSEREAASSAAAKFLKEKNFPEDTQVLIMPESGELTMFKQFFSDWKDKDQTLRPGEPRTIGNIAIVPQVPFDASSLHSNKKMAAQHCMVDDGSGKVQVWRVEGSGITSVEPDKHGQFFGGDCYLILYSYDSEEKHIIYIWQGLKSSVAERAASAIQCVQLDDRLGGSPVQVHVTQGYEPNHLMSIFKHKLMVIHQGGTSRSGGQSPKKTKQLFHIRQSSAGYTRAVEVEPQASSLNTNDVFVLTTSKSNYMWKGKGATDEEIAAAGALKALLEVGDTQDLFEGKENDSFWEELGGMTVYQSSPHLQKLAANIRLFGCSNKTGNLIAEEVYGDIVQTDLATDDIMILDAKDTLFVWIGSKANEVEKTGSQDIARDYLKMDPSDRRGTTIITIKQGFEPPTFTGWFHAWDPKLWD